MRRRRRRRLRRRVEGFVPFQILHIRLAGGTIDFSSDYNGWDDAYPMIAGENSR